jgi:hypothetical protein
MAKKLIKLTALDIILQADAETIREAYESRVKIDDLLAKREEAYRQIEEIELQVEALVGEEGLFVYPAPPVSVAGFGSPTPSLRQKSNPTSKSKEEEAANAPAEEVEPELSAEETADDSAAQKD